MCSRYGVTGLSVFGSVARGDAGLDSDIDLLFEVDPDARLGFALFFDCSETPCSPNPRSCMRREVLLVSEIIDAAERIVELPLPPAQYDMPAFLEAV